jgi:hypothetical protein
MTNKKWRPWCRQSGIFVNLRTLHSRHSTPRFPTRRARRAPEASGHSKVCLMHQWCCTSKHTVKFSHITISLARKTSFIEFSIEAGILRRFLGSTPDSRSLTSKSMCASVAAVISTLKSRAQRSMIDYSQQCRDAIPKQLVVSCHFICFLRKLINVLHFWFRCTAWGNAWLDVITLWEHDVSSIFAKMVTTT